jgi:hypothetical protein
MLSRLRSAGWPQELIDQMYLDEDTQPTHKQREKGKKMKIKSSIETATALF